MSKHSQLQKQANCKILCKSIQQQDGSFMGDSNLGGKFWGWVNKNVSLAVNLM